MDSQKKKKSGFLLHFLEISCCILWRSILLEESLFNDFPVGYWAAFKLAQTHQWTLLNMKPNNSGLHVNHNNATASFQPCYYNMIILFRNTNREQLALLLHCREYSAVSIQWYKINEKLMVLHSKIQQKPKLHTQCSLLPSKRSTTTVLFCRMTKGIYPPEENPLCFLEDNVKGYFPSIFNDQGKNVASLLHQ